MSRWTALSSILLVAATTMTVAAGCTSAPEQTLVKEAPEGAVFLDKLPTRGTTVKYSGPLKSFHATHPVAIAPEVLARIFSGIRLSSTTDPATVPPNLFTPDETWFLASTVAGALKQASPDQRVRFQVGSGSAVTEGFLHVDQPVIRLALSRYRADPHQRDEHLSSYTLSFVPPAAVVRTDGTQSWMQVEPDQPRIAVDYEFIRAMPELTQIPAPPAARPSAPSDDASPAIPFTAPLREGASMPETRTAEELRSMKELVVKQAQELQSLKAEVEALRKRLAEQDAISRATPKAKPTPRPQ